jgi:P27 family predicted phage terminase small subunit
MPGKPVMPLHLTAEQRSCWRFLASAAPAGLYIKADTALLERASCAWALYRAALREVTGTGLLVRTPEGPRRNPAMLILKQASEELSRCTAELGLSPLARTKLPAESEPDNDPMAQLFALGWDRAGALTQSDLALPDG